MAKLGEANIGGRLVPAWLVGLTAEELDGLKWHSNPNLLHNWYFRNAVNQRGATGSITINRYFIDRWLYSAGDSASSLTFSDGVVTLNGTNGYCSLRQIFETQKSEFIGRLMTISALTTNMGLVSYTFTCRDGVESFKSFSESGSFFDFDTRYDNVLFSLVAQNETIPVVACKVEFGDQQTLAHQDSSGNWVLNEIPDYGEQLRLCQRYFRRIRRTYLRLAHVVDGVGRVSIPLDGMRDSNPSVQFVRKPNVYTYNSWVTLAGASVSASAITVGGSTNIVLEVTGSSTLTTTDYIVNDVGLDVINDL